MLHWIAKDGDVELLKFMIDHLGYDVNATDAKKLAPIHMGRSLR